MNPIAAIFDGPKVKTQKGALKKPFLLSPDIIVQRFFSYPENVYLLYLFLDSQSLECWKRLEDAFCNFYFEVRFTKYLSSTIKFTFIDYERRRRRREERNIVIFDMGLYEENDKTFGERYLSQNNDDENSIVLSPDPQKMLDSLSNECIYKAFSELTQNQKIILTFSYSMCYLDKEIAEKLSITPQAVSKTRNAALANLRKRIECTSLKPLTRREAN
ncbi:RNA polymerase sigma factor [Cohnella laeviribosi]|uniref:RNA polymerase sigma factor n=1 Tax=Cohnella laeviribosi TaxID=380174 RepID=UPI000379C064|nr:sigma-70 family RNA polymerase sigma factor [Cohnella laeviribosi]